jgi:hypothetical protein
VGAENREGRAEEGTWSGRRTSGNNTNPLEFIVDLEEMLSLSFVQEQRLALAFEKAQVDKDKRTLEVSTLTAFLCCMMDIEEMLSLSCVQVAKVYVDLQKAENADQKELLEVK